MTKFTLLAIVAILPAVVTGPAHAMAAIQEPGAYAFAYPNANLGFGPGQYRTRVASHKAVGSFNAFALAPSATSHARKYR
jgi:hypothetical protein